MTEELQINVYGDDTLPTLVYLPGLHGDWTLIKSFRLALTGRVRFVEITYPRSLTWSIADYAHAIQDALQSRGIIRGWLLGESFGSQIAWQIIAGIPRTDQAQPGKRETFFKVDGLILAGGFVKHPWKWGPGLLRWIGGKTSMKMYRLELKIYTWYSRFRHRHAPETLDSVHEFAERRTGLDRQAMQYRLVLLDHYDPRPVARQTRIPVHYLAGLVDPLVPWPLVRWWLRMHCPGYCGGKTFWLADHNVLATSPTPAANLILKWMKSHVSA